MTMNNYENQIKLNQTSPTIEEIIKVTHRQWYWYTKKYQIGVSDFCVRRDATANAID